MNRATPEQIRKALDAARALADAGIRFVPVPVLSDGDHDHLVGRVIQRLEKLADADTADQKT